MVVRGNTVPQAPCLAGGATFRLGGALKSLRQINFFLAKFAKAALCGATIS